ncbi:MAG: hypothetical protein IJ456_10430 [Bacteroides sp.]|nr:hypothetical protein [Bacteroides sp.]
MGTNRFLIRVRPLSIILLVGLCMYSSCIKEQPMERSAHDVLASRGVSFSSSLTDFFNHSIEKLDSVITMLSAVNEEKNFIGYFLKEYGIPLWNYTYIIDDGVDKTYFVPLYNGQSTLEINSLWFFHISSDGKMIYAPFRRDDPSISGHHQCFVFDLLSYLVFGEENASGLVFKEKSPLSRGYITMYECTPICVYAGGEEYWYEDCVYRNYWVDETWKWITVNSEAGGGGGGIVSGGGGSSGSSNSGSSASTKASQIFYNDSLSADSWRVLNQLLETVLIECMGKNLFNQIVEKLEEGKIEVQFVNNGDSRYNVNDNILKLDVNQLESDIFFHELYHLYQDLTGNTTYTLDMEIEAHYAQYHFIQNQLISRDFKRDKRWNAIISLEEYFDETGTLKEFYDSESLNFYLNDTVDPTIRSLKGYENYSSNRQKDNTGILLNYGLMIENCN